MSTRTWIGGAGALALLLSAGPAWAQQWTPRTEGNRLGADIDFLPNADRKLFNVSFIGQVRLTRHVYLDFDLPWGYAGVRGGELGPGDGRFVLGNPTLGAHYARMLGRHVALFVGGAFTIPTHLHASADNNAATQEVYTRAFDDSYRFLPEYVDVHGRIGVEIGVRPLFLRFDVRPILNVPVGGDVDRSELLVQFGNELELLANMGLGGGVRLQMVLFPATEASPFVTQERAQLAFEPYFAYEPEPHGFFARIGVLIAANDPLGFGFDRDKVATIRATLGGKW